MPTGTKLLTRKRVNRLRRLGLRPVRRLRRRAMAALEVVMTTALVFPLLCFMAYVGIRVCRNLFAFIGNVVGSMFM
jgi:hypothetical protein